MNKPLVVIGIAVLLLLLGIYMGGITSTLCTDVGCFIARANQCKTVTYDETTDIGTISYSVDGGKTAGTYCVMTKEIVELDKNEDAFLKTALEKKTMECVYSPYKFNGQWMTSMVEGLEDCHGDLKEVVGQLLLLVD